MLRNTMNKSYCTTSASSSAEAGFAYPSCAGTRLSISGISLLVSVFLIIFALCAETILAGCGLVYIINVPVLILAVTAAIISLTVFSPPAQA